MHSDSKKRSSFFALLFATGDVKRSATEREMRMMQHTHELEFVIQDLFDQLYPLQAGNVRAVKPFLSPALGSIVPDSDSRRLQANRSYYRLDFHDFLDYATSDLIRPPTLSRFPDGEVQLYQALDFTRTEPLVTLEAFERGVAVLDVALARNKVFVSVTMRFRLFGNEPPNMLLATLTLAPMPKHKGDPAFDPDSAPLEEWDRYTMHPPVDEDREWRFTMSGIYTDYLIDDMEKVPGQPGALSPEQIVVARDLRNVNHSTYGGLFELARLALYLPAYFDFMYDLVVTETLPTSPRAAKVGSRSAAVPSVPATDQPIYRIVKSIRVIRQDMGDGKKTRKWTPPLYSFAVMGHWRHFADATVKGHGPVGDVVFGRTWVRDYTKCKGKPPRPEDTQSFSADPRVVINIKQTLAHARDIIVARTAKPTIPSEPPPIAPLAHSQKQRPTKEWMAAERTKLNAALRFLIMKRDDFRCRLCGHSAADDPCVRLEVDHIKPVSAWGATVEENLWAVCKECNRGKRDRPLEKEEL